MYNQLRKMSLKFIKIKMKQLIHYGLHTLQSVCEALVNEDN